MDCSQKAASSQKSLRLYATHGRKKPFGIPAIINGRMALGYFDGDQIVSYIYWDEANKRMYAGNLPVYNLNF